MDFRFWIFEFGLSTVDDVDLVVTNVKYTCHPERSEGSLTGSLGSRYLAKSDTAVRRDPSLPFGMTVLWR